MYLCKTKNCKFSWKQEIYSCTSFSNCVIIYTREKCLPRRRASLEGSYSQSNLIHDCHQLISCRWPEICCSSETIAFLHLANWLLFRSVECCPVPSATAVIVWSGGTDMLAHIFCSWVEPYGGNAPTVITQYFLRSVWHCWNIRGKSETFVESEENWLRLTFKMSVFTIPR